MKINNEHKRRIEEVRGYIYIGTYERNDEMLDGRILGKDIDKANKKSYVKIKCPYCGTAFDTALIGFVNQKYECKYCCNKYENSIAYHIEVELGEPLEKYWDFEKNTINPRFIYRGTHDKFWFKCIEKEYHGSYLASCDNFARGCRCPYCANQHGKVHPKDSFGAIYPQHAQYWSDKNKVSPFEVTPRSTRKFWFNCKKCGTPFQRKIVDITKKGTYREVTCRKCSSSQGERKIKQIFDSKGLIEDVDYIHDKTYFKDLKGEKGYLLRPDFILPNEKIWIEYDGLQHDEYREGFHQSYDSFITTKQNDEIKNIYAQKNNWKMIRIKQNEFKNIESIIDELGIGVR